MFNLFKRPKAKRKSTAGKGNYIHPTAIIYPGVVLGNNNYIGPYCVIGSPAEWRGHEFKGYVLIGDNNTFAGHVTVDSGGDTITEIGDNCYLMKHTHVGHDAILKDWVTLSPGAKIGGHAHICKKVTIGMNAVVHQKKTIPQYVMLGMGAVVTKGLDMEPGRVYAGNPARELGNNTNHPEYNIFKNEYP